MTIRHALSDAITLLERENIPSSRLDAELLLCFVINQSRAWLLAHDDSELDEPWLEKYNALIARRLVREPVVHLTGHREFFGLNLAITPAVLTPRVETEQMVEWAVAYAPQSSRLIDIGTGSGAIALAIASVRPDLAITATEVSVEALEVAHLNAKELQLDIKFAVSDLWSNVQGTFDTVVTNLPYLRNDAEDELMAEVKHEPSIALFGGSDGLSLYRRFLADILDHLTPGGYLFTECDPWQQPDLIAAASAYELNVIKQGYFILGFIRSAAN